MANDHMNLHEAELTRLKGGEVLVDKKIKPLVCFIDGLDGVSTYSSCQGGSDQCTQQPFVCFKCDVGASLIKIRDLIKPLGDISYNDNDMDSIPDYRLDMHSTCGLGELIRIKLCNSSKTTTHTTTTTPPPGNS